jgi:hypothetical protein
MFRPSQIYRWRQELPSGGGAGSAAVVVTAEADYRPARAAQLAAAASTRPI